MSLDAARRSACATQQEGERIMRICNSCRYCEGFCAVFPAIERRQTFNPGDLDYLANLCHNCSECYYACQYAPPHEFAVNVPQLLAQIRVESYARNGWPNIFRRAFRSNGALIAILCLLLVIPVLFAPTPAQPAPSFYSLIPHAKMVAFFNTAALFVLLAFAIGFVRFWRNSGESLAALLQPRALIQALKDILTLHYLDGGGSDRSGCTYPAAQQSQSRRCFHHLTFYGFALCFASTTTAALYHYILGLRAPYAYTSLPVVLGTVGGLALIAGTLGLLVLKQLRNPATQDMKQTGMDLGFLLLLLLTSITGLALLALRATTRMPELLYLHLALVFVLFLTLPYGKFVHAIYRTAALVKNALEAQRGTHR
jgi:citrate/tricarballylate utilization protein